MAELVCPCGAVVRARTGAELLGMLEAHLSGHKRDSGRFLGSIPGEHSDARSDARRLEKLTETERRVTERAASGRTNHEIAEELHLSPKTVEWNLTKIYRRLGVRSRTELALKVWGFPRTQPAMLGEPEEREGAS